MTDVLQEFCDSRGVSMRVDRREGVIRGVKVLGMESRNCRSYLPDAIKQAAALYEGAKVNVNHPKGSPTGPRDYQDRIGTIRNASVRSGEGIFGDFHFNPKHVLAEQLMWDAEHSPENVGFSHNVEARVTRQGERVVVEAITRVQSVDLVADPATTRGLFEATDSEESTAVLAPASVKPMTLEELCRDYPALVESIRQEQSREVDELRGEIGRLREAEQLQQRRMAAKKLLREFHLPDPEAEDPRSKKIVSEQFWNMLEASSDEAAMRGLVEERAKLVNALTAGEMDASSTARPRSRDQQLVNAQALDGKAFLEAIMQ